MSEKSSPENVPAQVRKSEGNPTFKAMGLPRLSRIKLPSRNWLIFIGIVGSWTGTLLYDRYHKKRSQRKWATLVSHLSKETISANMMPRKITILLAAPPGDSIRVAREHFHEYVKPILVAGALDWEVIEGRKEGEVRAGLAEKIRKLRKRNGEQVVVGEEGDIDKDELIRAVRETMGVKEWDGVRGDLVLGRHTWKEYVRGLHEGWLGPMNAPQAPASPEVDEPSLDPMSVPTDASLAPEELNEGSEPSIATESTPGPPEEKKSPESEKPPPKSSPTPPYITPADYVSCSPSPTIPSDFPPSTALPLPHVLGFLNTPRRIYRFLNRRHLAESTGSSVAALVLAAYVRPYNLSTQFASAIDPGDASPRSSAPEEAATVAKEVWEQEQVLKEAEAEWHKSAWKENQEGNEIERVWKEDTIVDPRIGERMRAFELPADAAARAEDLEEQRMRQEENYWLMAKKWAGQGPKEKHGSDMGLEGGEDD